MQQEFNNANFMKAQFRIYKNNGERDVLKWSQNMEVADNLSEEEVFNLFKNQYLTDAKEIVFSQVNSYRTEKQQNLVLTFYW